MRLAHALAPLLLLAALACGKSTSPAGAQDSGTPATATITISAFAFSPTNLSVKPGTVVTVVNSDSAPHSVTSQASAGAYTPGAVAGIQFDTGSFSSGSKTFTIPANAAVGTVIPYYCVVHTGMMANAGQVTIVAP